VCTIRVWPAVYKYLAEIVRACRRVDLPALFLPNSKAIGRIGIETGSAIPLKFSIVIAVMDIA